MKANRSADEQSRSHTLQSGDAVLGFFAVVAWLGARYPVGVWFSLMLLGTGLVLGLVLSLSSSPVFRGSLRLRRMQSRRLVGVLGLAFVVVAVVSTLSLRSLQGQHLTPGLFEGEATLLTDPQWRGPLLGAEARVVGKRVSIAASGAPAWRLARAEAGNVVRLRGRISALRAPVPSFMIARHLSAKLSVQTVSSIAAGNLTARAANGIRGRLLASGSVLSPKSRALYGGFLLGDDRDQPPEVTDDFRAAGLTHLLVVSGQNVAFTLAVFSPLLMRLSLRARFFAVLTILGVFALVTRFEPSVLRAVAMAALVALTRLLGRPQHSARILAIAVISLLLIDPMLAWSVGFLLSVGACAGLAILVPRFERMRGPRWLVTPLATTLAAQTGASLVMIPVFGSVPVVAPLANMVALPAAAPIMSWGVAAGFPAGFLGDGVARIVHLPTELLLRWIAAVARIAAMIPLGQIDSRSVFMALGLVGVFRGGSAFLLARQDLRGQTDLSARTDQFERHDWSELGDDQRLTNRSQGTERFGSRRAGLAIWFVVFASIIPTVQALTTVEAVPPVIVKNAEVLGVHSVAGGVMRTVDVLVVSHGADPARLLAALRRYRIRAIGTLVIASGGRPQTQVVAALSQRVSVGAVLVGNRAFGGLAARVIVPDPMVTFAAGSRIFQATTGPAGKVVVVQTG